MIPVTRHVTHDRAAVQGHRAAAGLVLHHLQVRTSGERVVARAGSVDRPALERTRLQGERRERAPAGHGDFEGSALLDRGVDAGGAERAGVVDAQGAFADDQRTIAVEGRAVVAEGEDAVADLAEVEEALVVEPTDARAGAELHAGGRAGAEGAGFDEDLVVVVQRDRARAQRGAEAVHLHDQRAGLAGAGHGVGRAEMEGGDLLQTVGRQDAVDAIVVDRSDRAARPGEEVRRAAVVIIPDLGEGERVVAVRHAAARQRDRTRTLGARGEELDAAAVDDPRARELRLIGADVEEGRARLVDLRREDPAVDLQRVVGSPDQGFARAVARRAEIEVGVDGRSVAGLQQAAAAEGDAVEAAVGADVDVAVGAERVEVEVGAERSVGGAEVEDRRAVVRGDRQRAAGRGDVIGGGGAGRDRDEAEGGVVLEELVADALGDPRRDHAVRHQRGAVGGQEAHGRSAAGDAETGVRVRAVHHARDHQGAGADAGDVAGDQLGEEGAAAAQDDFRAAGDGERADGLGVIGAGGAVTEEFQDGGVEGQRGGVGPASLGRGGGKRIVVVEAEARTGVEDPGVGIRIGRTADGAVRGFDAHFAEDVDAAGAEGSAEGRGRRLTALQDQDRATVTVHVAGTGHQRAAAERVRRIGAEEEREVAEAGVGHADDQGIAGAGQLGADDRRVQGEVVRAAAEEELGAAGAPRGEARGCERTARIGTEVPVAAPEGGHVRRGREGGVVVEGEHAGPGSDRRESVVEIVEPGLAGGRADAERRQVEGAGGADFERGAAEIGGRTQAEDGRRVDDDGGTGGAQGGGVLVDAHGALLEVESSGPAAAGGVIVEV